LRIAQFIAQFIAHLLALTSTYAFVVLVVMAFAHFEFAQIIAQIDNSNTLGRKGVSDTRTGIVASMSRDDTSSLTNIK